MGDGASPEVFTAVANVRSIAFSGRDAEEIDFTHLASTGGFRELRAGFKDPGSIALETHFDPTNATHTNMLTKFLSGAQFNWRINYGGAGWAKYENGAGFIKNPGDVNINPNDPVGGTATVRCTGGTTFSEIP
jgi:predicted secreted protein